jgi:hypothetical protein
MQVAVEEALPAPQPVHGGADVQLPGHPRHDRVGELVKVEQALTFTCCPGGANRAAISWRPPAGVIMAGCFAITISTRTWLDELAPFGPCQAPQGPPDAPRPGT